MNVHVDKLKMNWFIFLNEKILKLLPELFLRRKLLYLRFSWRHDVKQNIYKSLWSPILIQCIGISFRSQWNLYALICNWQLLPRSVFTSVIVEKRSKLTWRPSAFMKSCHFNWNLCPIITSIVRISIIFKYLF